MNRGPDRRAATPWYWLAFISLVLFGVSLFLHVDQLSFLDVLSESSGWTAGSGTSGNDSTSWDSTDDDSWDFDSDSWDSGSSDSGSWDSGGGDDSGSW
jgi:hypothetical protein